MITAILEKDEHHASTEFVYLSFEALRERLAHIFEHNGCSRQVADILAGNCAAAERDAAISHGVFRIPGYVSSLRSGWVDGTAIPEVEDVAPGFLRVDARNGFAQPALAAARHRLIAKAKEAGIAVLAIRNSHHFGALSLDVEPFADEDLIALSLVNSMRSVAPHGAREAVFGTNPIAFAAPRVTEPPFVFDLATSSMSNGDVRLAALAGRTLPEGTGIDRDGKPTNEPSAVLDGGALLAFGGHKGATIAMMVELLCAALVGGRFSHEVDFSNYPGAETPCTGQTVIVIDPSVGAHGLPPVPLRVGELLAKVKEAGQDRLPGDRRLAARAKAEANGIPLLPKLLEDLSRFISLDD